MLTTGWVAKGWRLAASVGWVVNRSLVAGPIVMVTGSLIAGVNKPSVAVRVWVPATSMLHAEKVAMPATAATGFAAHPNTVNMGRVMPSLTELVSVVTVLPPASWIVTTGWVGNATPPVESLGCVVNASFAAGPTVMVNVSLTAEVNVPSVAVSA